jgi:hypothetical protein
MIQIKNFTDRKGSKVVIKGYLSIFIFAFCYLGFHFLYLILYIESRN